MKHRGYYLEKVIFVLSSAEVFLPFEESLEKLCGAGISVEVLLVEEFLDGQVMRLEERNDEVPIEQERNKEVTEEQRRVIVDNRQLLYVTDHGRVAGVLLGAGLPVLGYRHENNTEEGFAGVQYIVEAPEGIPAEYFERVFRRYAGLPWSILETEHCYVRESTQEDVESFYTIYKESEITRYTEGLYEHAVSEKAYIREYIEKVYAYFEFGIWTVILKETGAIIGRAGISVREGFELPELGYVFGVPWQGKGLAFEVCKGILQYAAEELEVTELQVLIQEGNEASVKLARKLGFLEKENLEVEGKRHLRMVLQR